jgi:hypothetical protein
MAVFVDIRGSFRGMTADACNFSGEQLIALQTYIRDPPSVMSQLVLIDLDAETGERWNSDAATSNLDRLGQQVVHKAVER